MKKLTLSVLVVAVLAFSTRAALADTPSWTCEAMGQQQVGGPVGSIVMTAMGSGDSEFSASDAALQNCMEQGLELCSVTDCFQD